MTVPLVKKYKWAIFTNINSWEKEKPWINSLQMVIEYLFNHSKTL